MTDYRIEVDGLRKSYGGRVVNDIPKLTLGERRIEGLIGPNNDRVGRLFGRPAFERGRGQHGCPRPFICRARFQNVVIGPFSPEETDPDR